MSMLDRDAELLASEKMVRWLLVDRMELELGHLSAMAQPEHCQ